MNKYPLGLRMRDLADGSRGEVLRELKGTGFPMSTAQ
jgi:hypothetical protein